MGAVASVMTSLPDAKVSISHNTFKDDAIKSSDQKSRIWFGEGTSIEQAMKLICSTAKIGDCNLGDPITVGKSYRIVTSHQIDEVGATREIGVSAPFDYRLSFTTKRYVDAVTTTNEATVNSLKIAIGQQPYYGEQANSDIPKWTFCIRQCDWYEDLKPQSGDQMTDDSGKQFRVMRAEFRDGVWMLSSLEVA